MSRSRLRRLCQTHRRTLLHRGLFASGTPVGQSVSYMHLAYCVKTKQASGVVEIIDVAVFAARCDA